MVKDSIVLLNRIINSKTTLEKSNNIKNFQSLIWNDEGTVDGELSEILSTLAYDLDFYEPDFKLRQESPSFYGDERLKEEVNAVLIFLNEVSH